MNRAFRKVALTGVLIESTIVKSASPFSRATLFVRFQFANSMKCLSGLKCVIKLCEPGHISNNMSSCTTIN